MSSSYSCPGCCPESGPFGSIIPPEPVFIGSIAQVNTTGTVTDCNGNTTTIGWFGMYDFWVDDPSIISYSPDSGSYTMVEGLANGGTFINGSWYWDNWESDGWSMCWETRGESTDSQPVDVPSAEVSLTNAKIYELTAAFVGSSSTTQIATLNVGSSSHENDICGNSPQEFTVTVTFLLPAEGVLVPSRCTARPEGVPDQNYNVGTPTCQMDQGMEGHMSGTARRRCCGGPDNHPGIRFVIGANKSGQTGTIDTPGSVRVLCNQ